MRGLRALLAHATVLTLVCLLLGACSAVDLESEDDGRVVRYAGEEGVTALATLKALTGVATRDTQYGEFVVAIGGVPAAPGEFWAFLVNGELVPEGAGTWRASAGDVGEWRLRAKPRRDSSD